MHNGNNPEAKSEVAYRGRLSLISDEVSAMEMERRA
jgi:hypothetical protein